MAICVDIQKDKLISQCLLTLNKVSTICDAKDIRFPGHVVSCKCVEIGDILRMEEFREYSSKYLNLVYQS